MNKDLIKRGDVMDALEKEFDNYNMAFNMHGGFAQAVPDAINNIPTSYDVDKVVEQLKELKTYKLDMADSMSELMNKDKLGNYVCLEDVIKIVKGD